MAAFIGLREATLKSKKKPCRNTGTSYLFNIANKI